LKKVGRGVVFKKVLPTDTSILHSRTHTHTRDEIRENTPDKTCGLAITPSLLFPNLW